MPSVRDFREQRSSRSDEKGGGVTLCLGAVAAFAMGALLVTAWGKLPSLLNGGPRTPSVAEKLAPTFASTHHRVGRASTAPVLKLCMAPVAERLGAAPDAVPGDLYPLLKMVGTATRAGALMGRSEKSFEANVLTALMWGEVADCVYRQNGRTLCDPDNRAFALEAANTLVRQTALVGTAGFAKIMEEFRKENGTTPPDIPAMQQRVLGALRARLRDGRLIAKDFGSFPSEEIRRVLQEIKPERNACAEDGILG